MQLKPILESLLFVSGKSLGLSEILEVLRQVPDGPQPEREEVRKALDEMQQEWEARGGGFALVSVAGGYEFRTRPDHAAWIRAWGQSKPQRLSQPAVESLALIAYRQPLTRAEIESIRGVDSGGVLKSLLERRLVRIAGRKDEPGRPIIYATTREFLEMFGLADLSELPPLQELEARILKQEAQKDEASPEVADLMITPEEQATLGEEEREMLEQLDEGLKHLKDLEKGVPEIPETKEEGERVKDPLATLIGTLSDKECTSENYEEFLASFPPHKTS